MLIVLIKKTESMVSVYINDCEISFTCMKEYTAKLIASRICCHSSKYSNIKKDDIRIIKYDIIGNNILQANDNLFLDVTVDSIFKEITNITNDRYDHENSYHACY
jgi:hypothetical protein